MISAPLWQVKGCDWPGDKPPSENGIAPGHGSPARRWKEGTGDLEPPATVPDDISGETTASSTCSKGSVSTRCSAAGIFFCAKRIFPPVSERRARKSGRFTRETFSGTAAGGSRSSVPRFLRRAGGPSREAMPFSRGDSSPDESHRLTCRRGADIMLFHEREEGGCGSRVGQGQQF